MILSFDSYPHIISVYLSLGPAITSPLSLTAKYPNFINASIANGVEFLTPLMYPIIKSMVPILAAINPCIVKKSM